MDLNDILKKLACPGCQYADIYHEKTTYSLVTMEENRLEKVVSGSEEGIGLRVISGFKTYYAHTNDMKRDNVSRLAAEIGRQAGGGGDPIILAGEAARPSLPSGEEPLPVSRRISLVRLANDVARGYHPSIRQVQVSLVEKKQELTILGLGRKAEGSRSDSFMVIQTIAGEGNLLERGYEVDGRSEGSAFLDEKAVESLARKSAKRAVKLLGAGPAPAGTMTVVLSSEAGGTMVHEAIGHGLENDLAGQGFSVYSGKIGSDVASSLICVVDDPTIPGKRGSYRFDDEGSPSSRNRLVERGRLNGFISDILSAAKYGGAATGNGRRQSFRHPPIPRMSNTLIMPGGDRPEDIISGTEKGLFVVKMGGGQVNTVNGDFVFEVSEGYLLESGRVGPMVRGALLIGNGPAILREIDAVGSDLGYGIGTCGKEGQGVPVADAQPTLRIPRLVVGGRT